MKYSISFSALVAVCALASSGMAADYYVSATGNDDNAGTALAPFATVAKALAQSNVTKVLFQTDMNLGTASANPSKTDCAIVVNGQTVTLAGDQDTTKTITGRLFAQASSNVTVDNLAFEYTPASNTDFEADRGVVVTEGTNVTVTMNNCSVTQKAKGDAVYLGWGSKNNSSVGTRMQFNNSIVKTEETADYCSQGITLRGAGVRLVLDHTSVICPENAGHPFAVVVQGANSSVIARNSIIVASKYYALSVDTLAQNSFLELNDTYVKGWGAIAYNYAVQSGILLAKNTTIVGVNKSSIGSSNSYAAISLDASDSAACEGVEGTFENCKIMTEAGSYKNLGLVSEHGDSSKNDLRFSNCVFENNSTVEDPVSHEWQPSINSPNGNIMYNDSLANDIRNGEVTKTIATANDVLVFRKDDYYAITIEAYGATAGTTVTALASSKDAYPPPAYFKHPENLKDDVLVLSGTVGDNFSGKLVWPLALASEVDTLYRVADDNTVEVFSVENGKLTANSRTQVVTAKGVTGFSKWYAGLSSSVPVTMSGFELE